MIVEWLQLPSFSSAALGDLLQVAAAAGNRNSGIAVSAQCPAAAPPRRLPLRWAARALLRLALSSLSSQS